MECVCGVVATGLTFCEECHRYWRGGEEVPSVTRIVREVLPSSYEGVDPAVIENARERGVEVDTWFCRWLVGDAEEIGDGVLREDSAKILTGLCEAWPEIAAKSIAGFADFEPEMKVQHRVDGGSYAGTADMFCDLGSLWRPAVIDLKCTYEPLISHVVQLGAYAKALNADPYLLHAPKHRNPRLIRLDKAKAVHAWENVCEVYALKAAKVSRYAAQ